MAEKLEVIVQQQVGVIEWNFEELKAAVAQKMQDYEGLVYTDENIKEAKADIATLRKLKKDISDKRIEIKNRCLEPYNIIEQQAAELTELIDKPIGSIDSQLSEYEQNRRAAVREKIHAYMDEVFKNLPSGISERLKADTYDTKFENVSTPVKTWKQYIDDAAKRVERDLMALNDENVCPEEFRESAMKVYAEKLALNDALARVAELRNQKERILASERERIAAEEREKARKELEAVKNTAPEPVCQNNAPDAQNKVVNSPACKNIQPSPENQNSGQNRAREDHQTSLYTLRIKATPEQIAKIKGYIEYTGAVYREVLDAQN